MTEQNDARSLAGPGTSPTGGLLRALLPERSVEDVLAGVLKLKLGDSEFRLPVLVIDKADGWRESLTTKFGGVMGALEGQTTAAGALTFFATQTPMMIEMLREYDINAVLPDDAWIRSHATEPEILRAFMVVLAASFPFVAAALDILAANPGALQMVLKEFRTDSGEPTSTPPGPTGGPRGKSGRRSQTSSS